MSYRYLGFRPSPPEPSEREERDAERLAEANRDRDAERAALRAYLYGYEVTEGGWTPEEAAARADTDALAALPPFRTIEEAEGFISED